ncbi:MAG: RDD family protein [Gammaproteobacteria bacterium]|nr:RDD family protein [Gammaproteobacteria bacterium]
MNINKTPSRRRYAGFWIRFAASMVDSLLALVIILPILKLVYGPEYFTTPGFIKGPLDIALNYLLPFIIIVIFWVYKSATPGKMLFNLIIVDAKTLQKPSTGQLIIRYLGYYVSTIPFCLGFVWIAFDAKKQGWHDKIAKTLVIKEPQNESA